MTGKQKLSAAMSDELPHDFEQSLEQLEKIVASMEAGQMTLEASLAAYERGVALAKACQAQLQSAEQRVKVLEQDLLRPFNEPETDEGSQSR